MKVYLCGPMTGIPQFNIPTFDKAAQDLRARGYEVVSPAELDDPVTRRVALESADGAPGSGSTNGQTWGDFLARDVKLIADEGIEALVVLPDWQRSRGGRLETFIARLCDLPLLRYGPDDPLESVTATEVQAAHGFGGGEERVTDPATGAQKGRKGAELGALDPRALLRVAEVAGFGARKYARFNFARGYAWSLSFDALQRHLLTWADGQEIDDESGLPHLAHAAWHCLALLTFAERDRGTDDRLHRYLDAA